MQRPERNPAWRLGQRKPLSRVAALVWPLKIPRWRGVTKFLIHGLGVRFLRMDGLCFRCSMAAVTVSMLLLALLTAHDPPRAGKGRATDRTARTKSFRTRSLILPPWPTVHALLKAVDSSCDPRRDPDTQARVDDAVPGKICRVRLFFIWIIGLATPRSKLQLLTNLGRFSDLG